MRKLEQGDRKSVTPGVDLESVPRGAPVTSCSTGTMSLAHQELTGAIIGAGIAVHKGLGPGFIEPVYENAMAIELQRRTIPFQRQLTVSVTYRGTEVGVHRLDLFVEELVVVELKAVKKICEVHFATVRSYLRAVEREHGLLLNFAKPTLEVKRVSAG